MFLFRIFGLFGFFTGPLIMAIIGAAGMVKILSLFKWITGIGGSGTVSEVASGGIFISTVGAITAATGIRKVTSKLRGLQRAVVAFGDDVDSPKRDRE